MDAWALFLLIVFVLGIVISSIMILKYNAKMKLHENVMRIIESKKIQASLAKNREKKDKKTNIK